MTAWMTLAEAADYIRAKDTRVLRNAIHAGDLPASLYGKRGDFRVAAEDLDAWLRSKPFNG
jgi:excisionase family DNA binding protein